LAGPAVFHRLKALRAGDTVRVVYDDAKTADFVVTGSDSYAKSDFPPDRVTTRRPTPSCGSSLRREVRPSGGDLPGKRRRVDDCGA